MSFVDELANVDRPLPASRVEAALLRVSGRPFTFHSRQGRPVQGVIHEGSMPAVVISAAQHANETSGVVGALRAAVHLQDRPNANFVVIPFENPDGYALHQALCALYPAAHVPRGALHCSRRRPRVSRACTPWFERQAREHAFDANGPQLHLNLWSIPKGFFLIVRYKPGHEETAVALLEHVTLALAGNARLASFNEQQLRAYRRYVADLPFEIRHGILITMASAPKQRPEVP